LPAPNEIVKSTPLKLITINTPITIKKLADCLGIQPSELGDDLVESGYKREDTYLIVSDVSPEIACIVAQKRGLMLQINRLARSAIQ